MARMSAKAPAGSSGRASGYIRLGLILAGLLLAAVLSWHIGNFYRWDVTEYHDYAVAFWMGDPPLTHLPVEYPPLSILVFSLTVLPPTPHYPEVFALWMAGLLLLGYAAFQRFENGDRAFAFAVYLITAVPATLLNRYDLVPAMITLAAFWLIERRRFGWVYPLLAAGALIKLYPLFLLPIAVAAQWRARSLPGTGDRLSAVARGLAIFGVIMLAGFGAAVMLDPANGLGAFVYAWKRPVQVESVPATVLWIASFFGVPASAVNTFKSFNYLSPAAPPVLIVSEVLMVAGCAFVYWRHWIGRLETGQAFVAIVCVLLCTSKVLSPQYMIWLAPLVAAVAGFRWRWFLLFALTLLVYPVLYQTYIYHSHDTVSYGWAVLAGIAVRNAYLVYLTIGAMRGDTGRAGERREPADVIQLRRGKADRELPLASAD
jgi:hypothetical protein